MEILFDVIAPIIMLVLLGWGLAKVGLVPSLAAGSLMQQSECVFYGAAPAAVFEAVVSNPKLGRSGGLSF